MSFRSRERAGPNPLHGLPESLWRLGTTRKSFSRDSDRGEGGRNLPAESAPPVPGTLDQYPGRRGSAMVLGNVVVAAPYPFLGTQQMAVRAPDAKRPAGAVHLPVLT